MSFELMDRAQYRAMSNEAFELRRQEVRDELENAESEFTAEQMRGQVNLVNDEVERRKMLDSYVIEERKAVAETAPAKVIETTGEPQVRVKRDMSLGGRVWDEIQKRGYSRDEKFQVANIAFRAYNDAQTVGELDGAASPNYYDDVLTQVDPEIKEGYRREQTIWQLFSHESTEKDAVAWYTEGAFDGSAAMTAEAGAFSQIHVNDPDRHETSLKKVTAIWKQTDEILSDAPRFVSHVNSRAAYNLDTVVEDQLIAGNGLGNNLTGLLNTSGILTASSSAYNLAFIESLLKKKTAIRKATPNFTPDTLLIADEDYDELMCLKNSSDQYVLGGPVGLVYGSGVTVGEMLWRTIRIVPTPALTSGTSVLGAFKLGATVYEHVTGRRFDVGFDGDDFSHGRVSFRAYQRLALAVEYPKAFCKYTVGSAESAESAESALSA